MAVAGSPAEPIPRVKAKFKALEFYEIRAAGDMFVGSLYLYGIFGNLWGTRGRHPGWMLMAAALILIIFGVHKFGG
jgi:hypothetical protein